MGRIFGGIMAAIAGVAVLVFALPVLMPLTSGVLNDPNIDDYVGLSPIIGISMTVIAAIAVFGGAFVAVEGFKSKGYFRRSSSKKKG